MVKEPKSRSSAWRAASTRWLRRGRAIIPIAGLLLAVQACENRIEPDERNRIARAYADVLFLQAKYPSDSTRQRRAVDSALRRAEFGSLDELKKGIDAVSEEPDAFRMLLDSAQRYLEAHQRTTPADSN